MNPKGPIIMTRKRNQGYVTCYEITEKKVLRYDGILVGYIASGKCSRQYLAFCVYN